MYQFYEFTFVGGFSILHITRCPTLFLVCVILIGWQSVSWRRMTTVNNRRSMKCSQVFQSLRQLLLILVTQFIVAITTLLEQIGAEFTSKFLDPSPSITSSSLLPLLSDTLSSSILKRSHDNSNLAPDIEDVGKTQKRPHTATCVTKHSVPRSQPQDGSWKNVLGPPPDRGTTKVKYSATKKNSGS